MTHPTLNLPRSVQRSGWLTARRRAGLMALVVGLFGTIMYFLPLVGALKPGGAGWPGFMLTGDVRMIYFPQFVEGYNRFWGGGIFGIDFLTDGGASAYGFRPNLQIFYPPYLVSYLFFNMNNFSTAAAVFCAVQALNLFASLAFAFLFARRFLAFSEAVSVLFAAMFALSYIAGYYIVQTGFLLLTWPVPVIAYLLCRLMFTRSRATPVLGSLLIVNYALTGYAPLMAAGLSVAIILGLYVFFTRIRGRFRNGDAWKLLLPPLTAVALGAAVVAPYFLLQVEWVKGVAHGSQNLNDTAFLLGLRGWDLFRAVSIHVVGGTPTEGRLIWGLTPSWIILLGFFFAVRNGHLIPAYQRVAFLGSLSLYTFVVAVSMGSDSFLSDIFYYGVPIFGSMHIYQRYMLLSQIFLAVMFCLSIIFVHRYASRSEKAWILLISLILTVLLGTLLYATPLFTKLVTIDYFAVELFMNAFAVAVLCLSNSQRGLVLIAFPLVLANLQQPYFVQRSLGSAETWAKMLPYDRQTLNRLVTALAPPPEKTLSKILYLTSEIDTHIPYNHTWLMSGGRAAKYMNYYGYEPHLAMDRNYFGMMGSFYGRHNAGWVAYTGVDHVVWKTSEPERLQQFLASGFEIGTAVPLAGDMISAPVTRRPQTKSGDTLLSTRVDAANWKPILADGWALEAGRIVKVPGNRNHFGIAIPSRKDRVYSVSMMVSGHRNGRLTVAFGGTTGTEILPGGPERVERQFTSDGVGDLWVTAAPEFDGSIEVITVEELPLPPDPASPVLDEQVIDNGIIRLSSRAGAATLKSFSTDWSKTVTASISSTAPVRVSYLMWPISYMRPSVDGKKVFWKHLDGQRVYVDLPAGDHVFKIRFQSRKSVIFSVVMAGYLAAMILVAAAWLLAPWRGRIRSRWQAAFGSSGLGRN